MFIQPSWLGTRAAQERWGEEEWRQAELLRIGLGQLGLRLRADDELGAIHADAPGVLVSAVLYESDSFPLLEALKRLVRDGQKIVGRLASTPGSARR